ncbi:hypothetical protein [Dyella sp. 20L07]|uniref:hypothetical protein n=1 Tax=Dyella sp. 20L07 TaxID=3384240 RepID=UPI003D2CA4DE
MAIDRPYRRTARPFVGGAGYRGGLSREYLKDDRYAKGALHYLRAVDLLWKDLLELFDYVEPADANRDCYSYRIHSLLQRACMEVEANLRAILLENEYPVAARDLRMDRDYWKVDLSHRLSSIRVTLLGWHGEHRVVAPFAAWAKGAPLPWYQAYNQSKHDRVGAFERANFGALVESVAACAALIVAQFLDEDFSVIQGVVLGGPDFGWDIGNDHFQVMLPRDWADADCYTEPNLQQDSPFQSFPYPPRPP